MNKELILDKTGGYPFDQSTLDFMQEATRTLEKAISSSYGNYVILDGVVDQGSTYSAGHVVVDGEVLAFVAGAKASNIVIKEEVVNLVFTDDQQPKAAKKLRWCETENTGGEPFTSFKRMTPIVDLCNRVTEQSRMFPVGMVITVKDLNLTLFDNQNSWIGKVGTEWEGWQIDLDSQSRLIVGVQVVADGGVAYGSAGINTDGRKSATLEYTDQFVYSTDTETTVPGTVTYYRVVKL